MGAEEKAVDEVDNDWSLDLIDVAEKLDSGYTLVWSPDGQLRLVAPSPIDPGDTSPAAA